jgi:uncharacterized damage-inducible protein DinB
MNDDFVSLFAFNRWADDHVLGACRKLSDAQYAAEPTPGWSSVRSTLVHIAVVTEGWLRGLTGEVVTAAPLTEQELPRVDDAARLLEQAYGVFDLLKPKLVPDWFMTPMALRRGQRSATLPPWVVLRHLVNHASYHRGQIASKLKRFGIEQPATDLAYWAMEQAAKKT